MGCGEKKRYPVAIEIDRRDIDCVLAAGRPDPQITELVIAQQPGSLALFGSHTMFIRHVKNRAAFRIHKSEAH